MTQNLVPTVVVLSVAVRLISAKIVIHMTIVAVTIHVQAMKKNVVQVEQLVNQMVHVAVVHQARHQDQHQDLPQDHRLQKNVLKVQAEQLV